MTAFMVALDSQFEDPNHGLDAVWRAGGADPGVAVRVILRAPDGAVGFGERRFVVDTVSLRVRVSEAPTLAEGDTFEIGAAVYEVHGAPSRDPLRILWTAEAREL